MNLEVGGDRGWQLPETARKKGRAFRVNRKNGGLEAQSHASGLQKGARAGYGGEQGGPCPATANTTQAV